MTNGLSPSFLLFCFNLTVEPLGLKYPSEMAGTSLFRQSVSASTCIGIMPVFPFNYNALGFLRSSVFLLAFLARLRFW